MVSSGKMLYLIILLEVWLRWGRGLETEGGRVGGNGQRFPWPLGATDKVVETVKILPLICQFTWKSPWKRLKATGIVYFLEPEKELETMVQNWYLIILQHALGASHACGILISTESQAPSLPTGMNASVPSTEIHLPSTTNLLTARLQYKTGCSLQDVPYKNIKSLCRTLETNMILLVNYTSISNFLKRCSSAGMGCPLLSFPSHCTAPGSVSYSFPQSRWAQGWSADDFWPKQLTSSLSSLCSSYSILNTSSSNALSFGDGILERRQYEDQGLGDTTPLTVICQPTQVRLTVRAASSTLLRIHWAPFY